MSILYLMCGIPGSGKSTFLEKYKANYSAIISRDTIRFSLVKPEEEYFSHEDEVLKNFWKQINEASNKKAVVYADQTSITPKSRKWFLQHITGYNYVNIIWIDEDLKTCLERNEMRRGTRSYVPPTVIRRMYNQFIPPSLNEGFDCIFYYNSKENRLILKERRFQ